MFPVQYFKAIKAFGKQWATTKFSLPWTELRLQTPENILSLSNSCRIRLNPFTAQDVEMKYYLGRCENMQIPVSQKQK